MSIIPNPPTFAEIEANRQACAADASAVTAMHVEALFKAFVIDDAPALEIPVQEGDVAAAERCEIITRNAAQTRATAVADLAMVRTALLAIPVHEGDVAYAIALLDAAQFEVNALCDGRSFRKSLPVQMTDSDVLLSNALSASRRILSSLTRKGLTREMRLPLTATEVDG